MITDGRAAPTHLWEAPDGTDGRLFAPAAERNKAAILAVLDELISASHSPEHATSAAAPGVTVLEVGCGTGQHAVAFSRALAHVRWVPTDPDPAHLESVRAWASFDGAPPANLLPPRLLDVAQADWPSFLGDVQPAPRLIYCANVIHIAPWSVAQGLLAGAGALLARGGMLALYGPFSDGGQHVSESNAAFDASLRARHPEWGVRDLQDLDETARAHGLARRRTIPMPANNHVVVYGPELA